MLPQPEPERLQKEEEDEEEEEEEEEEYVVMSVKTIITNNERTRTNERLLFSL